MKYITATFSVRFLVDEDYLRVRDGKTPKEIAEDLLFEVSNDALAIEPGEEIVVHEAEITATAENPMPAHFDVSHKSCGAPNS